MKNSKVKSVIGMLVMSVFFIATSTNNTYAQSQKNKRVQVVKKNKRATVKNGHVVVVPQNARVVRHNKVDYRFHEGNYYRPTNSGYVMANAPIGARITVLPNGYRQVKKRGQTYYRVGRTYYKPFRQAGETIVYEVIKL